MPVTLRWAVSLLGAETLAMVVVSIFLLYEDMAGTATSTRGAVMVTLFAVLLAGLLALLGLALWRRRAWARGPAIVLQLLALPIGYSMASGGLPWLGIPVMAIGLAGAAALLAPATRTALGAH